MDEIFENVVHVHSDARNTDASLAVAKEAKKRGITVSVDCEKDRKSTAVDELIELCDVLFTNSNYLGEYLARLTREKESECARRPLPEPDIIVVDDDDGGGGIGNSIDVYVKSLIPSTYFTRWLGENEKEVIVTQGSKGALHFKPTKICMNSTTSSDRFSPPFNNVQITHHHNSWIDVQHSFNDGSSEVHAQYQLRQVGVLRDVTVVDTTGAGDAFVGGYLVSKLALLEGLGTECIDDHVQFALEFGTYVGGRKLEGPGARTALPTGTLVDSDLGTDLVTVKARLKSKIGQFNDTKNTST
jgi:sugar/nucleoside kinase (ribokinase family)